MADKENNKSKQYVAFAGSRFVARGSAEHVVLEAKSIAESAFEGRIAIFDDATGRPVDFDLRGSRAEVVQRLATHPALVVSAPSESKRRGPGRPKLGVVSREISLLPRHWEWLGRQKGGASAALRKLVENARRSNPDDQRRRAVEAAHAFIWDIAGDRPHFEEASRALFARDFERFYGLISCWPPDIQEQLKRWTRLA